MNHTFDDATMDLPVALILIAAAIAATLLIGIAAVVHQNRAKSARANLNTPEPKPQPVMCECCRVYRARTGATDTEGKWRRVCFGCLDEGFVRGWWAVAS